LNNNNPLINSQINTFTELQEKKAEKEPTGYLLLSLLAIPEKQMEFFLQVNLHMF